MLTFLFSLMIVLFLVGFPVAFTLAAISLTYFLIQGSFPLMTVAQRFVVGTESYSLMAIPLYMLAGAIMNRAGITDKIFNFSAALISHLTGGLAHVNVLASFIFSGMSGSELADASGLGTVEIKAMVDGGYDKDFSLRVKLEKKGMQFIEVDRKAFQNTLKDIPKQFESTWVPGLYESIQAEIAKMD